VYPAATLILTAVAALDAGTNGSDGGPAPVTLLPIPFQYAAKPAMSSGVSGHSITQSLIFSYFSDPVFSSKTTAYLDPLDCPSASEDFLRIVDSSHSIVDRKMSHKIVDTLQRSWSTDGLSKYLLLKNNERRSRCGMRLKNCVNDRLLGFRLLECLNFNRSFLEANSAAGSCE